MFQLTQEEKNELVTICDRFQRLKHSSVLPRAFTEQGVAMLSTVLNSDTAIEVNIEIMRAFVRLRQMLLTHAELARKLELMEKKYDAQFKMVFEAIRELMRPPKLPTTSKRKIGFDLKEKQGKQVFQITLVTLSPKVMSTQGIDQLGGNPNPVAGPLNTALQHIANPKLLAHLLDLDRLSFMGKSGVAGNYK
jgi:hypothetical protein